MKIYRFITSSVGQKILMASSGIGLGWFVLFHMLGNLQIYIGPDAYNAYAKFLRDIPAMLWMARAGLIAFILIHMFYGIRLRVINRRARPEKYKQADTVQASVASRYMLETGICLFLFLVLHLLHYTFGMLQSEYAHLSDAQGRRDVYTMVVGGFQNPLYSTVYIVFMLIIGIHFCHAIHSLFQSLGFHHRIYTRWAEKLGLALIVFIVVGYASVPAAVLLDILRLPAGG